MLNHRIIKKIGNINLQVNLEQDSNVINEFKELEFDDIETNEIIDNEKNLFKNISAYTLDFRFSNGFVMDNRFEYNGFTEEEVKSKSKLFRYSYFIVSIYDTVIKTKQNLLHVGYIPLYLLKNLSTSKLTINGDYEFNRYYIDKKYGVNKYFYCRFYFFNAKNGNISSFINPDQNITKEDKLYSKMYFNEKFNSWFINNNITLNQITNLEYNNKLNNDINKSKIILPDLKNDKIFKIDGSYLDIE